MITELWLWISFILFILVMLCVDLFLLGGKKAHRVSYKEALTWVMVWCTLALSFNLLLWWYLSNTAGAIVAKQKALEFFTGYLIEFSLSMDNMFIFIMIFNYFAVPAEYQQRVLLYGVLGAIVMRLIVILLGVVLVTKFHWILYVFGIFLLITGIKLLIFANHAPDLAKNPLLNWMRRHFRITDTFQGEAFIVHQNGLMYLTPLFLVLILIETSDLIFALDSIPAIFAITDDAFIIFTSNIFAILGLRSLYFLLMYFAEQFRFLKYGIALILIFIGFKMILSYWYKIPIHLALGVVGSILFLSILLSFLIKDHSSYISK